ncbi:MAG TPA: hypothetical protein VMG12_07275 [Polyangiaceae bacterium]|nr:hypothetical protein [Polyangiaceae bacterium]
MKPAPARSLAAEGTAFERRLLESARSDAIPAASLERLARALAVPSVAPMAPPATPSRLVRQGSLPKVGACGVLGAVAVMAALRWLVPEPSAPAPSERSEPPALERAPMPETLSPETLLPETSAPLLAAPVEAPSEPPRATARVTSSREPTRPRRSTTHETKPSAADTDGLRAELIAVEAIQHALRAGKNSDAERQLAAYSKRFPRGELALEAELLGIDLDVAKGNLQSARAKARELLGRADASRYRTRLEALTRSSELGLKRRGAHIGEAEENR